MGFLGLDVYHLWESMHEVLAHLERVNPEAAGAAREARAGGEPFGENAREHARHTAFVRQRGRGGERARAPPRGRVRQPDHADDRFKAEQNALVAQNAERCCRA